jgi:hypothetical protein
MSEYGRLWQQVSDIRDKLHRLVPGTSKSEEWNRLPNAVAAVAEHTRALHELLRQWAELEAKMNLIKE